MHRMTRILSIFTCSLIFGHLAFAQNCTQKLVQAERDYEAGRLAGIPGSVSGCLSDPNGFSKEERIRAHRLLTLVYIFTDNEPEAERSLVNLLKADPEHLLDQATDPAELFYLYEQFQVDPIFRLGLRLGLNNSYPTIMESFATSNQLVGRKFYNGSEDGADPNANLTDLQGTPFPIGFWGELTFEKYLGRNFEIVGGVQARISNYDVDNFFNNEGERFFNFIRNRQVYGRVPIYVRYTYNYNRRTGAKPYAILGFSGDYLLSATYSSASRSGGTPFTLNATQGEDDLKTFNQVNDLNISLTAGLGVKLPIQNTNALTFEFRYDNSLLNYINAENRYSNQTVAFDLGHVEDNLTLNFVSFSIGYIYSIYNPKKKEE